MCSNCSAAEVDMSGDFDLQLNLKDPVSELVCNGCIVYGICSENWCDKLEIAWNLIDDKLKKEEITVKRRSIRDLIYDNGCHIFVDDSLCQVVEQLRDELLALMEDVHAEDQRDLDGSVS